AARPLFRGPDDPRRDPGPGPRQFGRGPGGGAGAFCAAPAARPGPPCAMEKRPFAELGVSAEILKAVDKLGYEEASPIQTVVIPAAMRGRDVVGQSATGSGKTAAFAIPAIEMVKPLLRKVQ